MRLTEKYRPQWLDDIVGQPHVAALKDIARRPRECCLLLEGPPGTGKTTAAYALARELGANDEYSGRHMITACDLTIDRTRDTFRTLFYTPWDSKTGWKCLVIEELDALPSPQVVRFLKTSLEQLPPKTVVVATSNGAAGIDRALLQRFRLFFFGGGHALAKEARDRVAEIWEHESGGRPLPPDWMAWGWSEDEAGDAVFSLRLALDAIEDALVACAA